MDTQRIFAEKTSGSVRKRRWTLSGLFSASLLAMLMSASSHGAPVDASVDAPVNGSVKVPASAATYPAAPDREMFAAVISTSLNDSVAADPEPAFLLAGGGRSMGEVYLDSPGGTGGSAELLAAGLRIDEARQQAVAVPLPAAAWLFLSALLGFTLFSNRRG